MLGQKFCLRRYEKLKRCCLVLRGDGESRERTRDQVLRRVRGAGTSAKITGGTNPKRCCQRTRWRRRRGEFSRNPAGADGKSLQRQTGNFTGDELNSRRLPRSSEEKHAASNTAALTEARKLPQTTTAGAANLMCSAEGTDAPQVLLFMMNLWNKFTI